MTQAIIDLLQKRKDKYAELMKEANSIHTATICRAELSWLIAEITEVNPDKYTEPKPPAYRTGLYDKRGTEICVGDFLELNCSGPNTRREYWYPTYKVVFYKGAFHLQYLCGDKSGDGADFIFRNCPNQITILAIPTVETP